MTPPSACDIRTVIARTRGYVKRLNRADPAEIGRTTAVQMALLLPRLLQHIDAQAVLLGNPRNRRGVIPPCSAMPGEQDTYDPGPEGAPPSSTEPHA